MAKDKKSKFCGCIGLRPAAHLVGLFQWVGVAAGLFFLSVHLMKGNPNDPYRLEFPIMLLVAYFAPAMAWFGSLFSHAKRPRKTYACFYFFCHFIVETYTLVIPIWELRQYWGTGMAVNFHPWITADGQTMRTLTVNHYLIINSVI